VTRLSPFPPDPERAVQRARTAAYDARTLGPGPARNPYWDAVRALPGDDITQRFQHRWEPRTYPRVWEPDSNDDGPRRDELTTRYAWAIPDPASLAFIAEHANGRIVEIGAGTGYWAWQLSQLGVDVVAYDRNPPDRGGNHWHSPRGADGNPSKQPMPVFFPVRRGGAPQAARHPDRTLLLCWPPYTSTVARRALRAYSGQRIIFIGEGWGGCTADDAFFRALERGWVEVVAHRLVQWSGIHDWATVYDRKPA